MKYGVAQKGMEVVVNDNEDSTIFTIVKVSDWLVELVYFENGRECYGGVVDVSMIELPSKKQLANRSK